MSSSMGSKRQLPPWMLRAPSADHLKNSVSESIRQEKGLEELSPHPKPASTCQIESTKMTESCVVKKCKTTRSRRKLVKQAEDDASNNMHEDDDVEKENYVPSRRKSKAKDSELTKNSGDELGAKRAEGDNMQEDDVEKEHYVPPRRKRKSKDLKATMSNVADECTLSEDELSVDDLISIAKEFVDTDKKKEGQRSSMVDCESERLPPSIFFDDKATNKDNTPSSATAVEAASSDLVECHPSERGDGVTGFSETRDDVAQDVIELLFGPLFKRRSKVKANHEL